MASGYFNRGKTEILNGNIDPVNDTIKVAKMATTYTPNIDTDEYYDDISADAVGTDQTLGTKSITKNDTDDAADFDAADTSETGQSITFDSVVYYKDTGTPSTSPLIAHADITEGTLTPVAGDIDLTFNSRGLFSF